VVYPPGALVTTIQTANGIQINYNNGGPNWSGGGFNYDNPETTNQVETADLSGLSNFTFSVYGDPSQVKMEIVDFVGGQEHKKAVYLTQVSPTSQEWSIPAGLFSGVDLSHTRVIYFIIEGRFLVGSLYIEHIP
jgi:hypothetical protein